MRVLNYGSLNLDHVYDVPHFVMAGETLSSTLYRVNLGGKGFNQSVALANAGVPVCHAGCIGSDGETLRTYLTQRGIDTTHLLTVDTPTGHAIIQVNAAAQNCILLYGGANQCVQPQQIDRVLSAFGSGDWLLVQNEISNLPYLISRAKARGMTVVLNPSPVSEALTQLSDHEIDWLILNEIECAALGCATAETGPEELLAHVHARYPQCAIVLTLGERGSMCHAFGTVWRCPAYAAKAVDTTAAGDTFTGYFLSAILEGRHMPDALQFASAAAAIAVTRFGAAGSIPMRDDVEAALSWQAYTR